MRTAVLISLLFVCPKVSADFCIETSAERYSSESQSDSAPLFGGLPSESCALDCESARCSVVRFSLAHWIPPSPIDVDPSMLESTLQLSQLASHTDSPGLAAQFEQQLRSSLRELGEMKDEADVASEDLSFRLLLFTLIVSVWLYRCRRYLPTSSGLLYAIFREMESEARTHLHEPTAIQHALSELRQLESQLDAEFEFATIRKGKLSDCESLKLMIQHVQRLLRRRPMKPSTCRVLSDHFLVVLKELRANRVYEEVDRWPVRQPSWYQY